MELTIITRYNGPVKLTFDINLTVLELIQQLCTLPEVGGEPENYFLLFDGTVMENAKKLKYYSVNSKTMLVLLPKLSIEKGLKKKPSLTAANAIQLTLDDIPCTSAEAKRREMLQPLLESKGAIPKRKPSNLNPKKDKGKLKAKELEREKERERQREKEKQHAKFKAYMIEKENKFRKQNETASDEESKKENIKFYPLPVAPSLQHGTFDDFDYHINLNGVPELIKSTRREYYSNRSTFSRFANVNRIRKAEKWNFTAIDNVDNDNSDQDDDNPGADYKRTFSKANFILDNAFEKAWNDMKITDVCNEWQIIGARDSAATNTCQNQYKAGDKTTEESCKDNGNNSIMKATTTAVDTVEALDNALAVEASKETINGDEGACGGNENYAAVQSKNVVVKRDKDVANESDAISSDAWEDSENDETDWKNNIYSWMDNIAAWTEAFGADLNGWEEARKIVEAKVNDEAASEEQRKLFRNKIIKSIESQGDAHDVFMKLSYLRNEPFFVHLCFILQSRPQLLTNIFRKVSKNKKNKNTTNIIKNDEELLEYVNDVHNFKFKFINKTVTQSDIDAINRIGYQGYPRDAIIFIFMICERDEDNTMELLKRLELFFGDAEE